METIDHITKKYMEFRNYHSSRLKEGWNITRAEWIRFFTRSEERAQVLLRKRGVSRLKRIDESTPWHIDNLEIADREVRVCTRRRNVASITAEGDTKLLAGFERFAVSDEPTELRTLTRKQWIAELRENAPQQ